MEWCKEDDILRVKGKQRTFRKKRKFITFEIMNKNCIVINIK